MKRSPRELQPKQPEEYSNTMESFMVEERKYTQLSTNLETIAKRRSTELDIIEEGSGDYRIESFGLSRDSQSESQSLTREASFVSSKATLTDNSFDTDEFDPYTDPEIDILKAVASRKKSFTGERAQSMAKELKREAPVKTRELQSLIKFMPFYFHTNVFILLYSPRHTSTYSVSKNVKQNR